MHHTAYIQTGPQKAIGLLVVLREWSIIALT